MVLVLSRPLLVAAGGRHSVARILLYVGTLTKKIFFFKLWDAKTRRLPHFLAFFDFLLCFFLFLRPTIYFFSNFLRKLLLRRL
jgi:hypothetical protein